MTSEGRVALVACGAIAQPSAAVVQRNGWPVDVHPLPPLLHNRPERIAGQVEELVGTLRSRRDASGSPAYSDVVVGYADCGTYGALDDVCARLALRRLPGLHCYDLYAGAERVQAFLEDQPGTYLLTDYLVRSFERSVVQEMGLDRYPELRDDYFHAYTRVVWLAQEPDPALHDLAVRAADRIGLPLTVVETGDRLLEQALATLLT